MNDKYQIEIDEFSDRFAKYKDARIVLYGIGRYTATLLEGLKGFHIVGLMDKDSANVGKIMFGMPVMDKSTAEKCADMVVINTAETYWDVIFGRIQDIKIPVYYKNGEAASRKGSICKENPFRELSYEDLCAHIETAEVISFDFFDTLFQRCVCNPQDIFSLLEIELGDEWQASGFVETRSRAKRAIRENYSLDELYQCMENVSGMPHAVIERSKSRELELEKRILVPRRPMLSALKRALESGKEVYIISDMYLPEEFYREALCRYDVQIPQGHILLSNVLDKKKEDGTIWEYYSQDIVKGRSGLHIGDHHKADIEEPLKYGIETYFAPKAWDLLSVSSLSEISAYICMSYDTAIMGCIMKELLQNPYVFAHTDGMVEIKDNYGMGYCVFGPVILTFFLWLLDESREDRIEKLVFMARDGYFLIEDFEYLCELMGEERKCCYLGISRQLAMAASVESWQDLMEYASMPYTGSIGELFEDRFGIRDVKEEADRPLEDYVKGYQSEIWRYLEDIRENYLKYMGGLELDERCAVIDLGYYGNNQRYLNRLVKGRVSGYYFNANLSEKNKNTESQKMRACFQGMEDRAGEKSWVLKKQIYLESFLTAPYGMIKAVDAGGDFVCGEPKGNQRCFRDKEAINEGVKGFISDYTRMFGRLDLKPDIEFVDRYYGCCLCGGMEFSDEVKRSFYNDNELMHRGESMVFY